jgi:5'-3' exonuclease
MLPQLGLVDGVVTEDSDAFLFGANTVYRNIFDDRKYVEVTASCLLGETERFFEISRGR